jgi:hypothetical protein
MFPVQCCGLWSLIAATHPECIGSKLYINYNTITYTSQQQFSFITLKKNKYASMYVKEGTVKIVWSDKINYEIHSDIFPRIIWPSLEKTSRRTVSYEMDDTHSWLTVQDEEARHQYTFRRDIESLPKGDNVFKIFLTQLFFDFIIRHIHL